MAGPYVDNFPFDNFRRNQDDILNKIEYAFKKKCCVILEAATGFGKSPVGIAAAMAEGSSYYVTSTKDLQSQLNSDFPWVKVCNGRQNHYCPMIKNNFYKTADHAPCLDKDYKCHLKSS